LTLRLNEDMMGQLRLLLQTIEQRANWGLAAAKHTLEALPESKTVPHSSDDAGSNKVLH
jgi:hypothetical protein